MRNLNEELQENHKENDGKWTFPHSEYDQDKKEMLELSLTIRGNLGTICSLIPKAVSDFMLRHGKGIKVSDFACNEGNYCWWLTKK